MDSSDAFPKLVKIDAGFESVTEFEFVILKAQLKFDYGEDVYLQTKHYKIERADVEEDIKYLEHEEKKFWKNVTEHTQPALLLPAI